MNETLEQIALRVARSVNADFRLGGQIHFGADEFNQFSRRLFEEYRKQQKPFGYVLVNTVDEEAVMFYSPDMKPDETKLKDKFELVVIYTAPIPTPEEVKDAARYRYLREENSKTYEEGALFVGFDDETGGDWIGSDLDYVIDAAMSAELGTQGEEK